MGDNGKLVRVERESLVAPQAAKVYSAPVPWEGEIREVGLRDYLGVLRKRRWSILTFLLAVVTLVAIASFKARPIYQAVARVEIDRENSSMDPFQSGGGGAPYWDLENYIGTRSEVLQSETLAMQTIQSLDLENHPEFAVELEEKEDRKVVRRAGALEKPAIVDQFRGSIDVRRVRGSRLLEVSFESPDPELAARIVNAHLENFIEHNFRTRYESTVKASEWLSTQLDDLKINVEKSEDAVVAYERRNRIWAIDDKRDITTQKLGDLNRELTLAETDRMSKEAGFQLARSGKMDAVPAVRDSGRIQSLLQKQTDLKDRYTDAVNRFGPKYPQVIRLNAQLDALEASLTEEKRNIIDRIESEYLTAERREKLLARALEVQKLEANHLAQKLVQYNILKREAETNKQLYDGLLQRIKEAGVSAGLRSSNIRVVDPALIPSYPVRPRKALNILLAVVFGLLGGVGLAFFREYMDNTVKTPADVEYLTRLPALAVVPAYVNGNGHHGRFGMRHGRLPRLLKGRTVEEIAGPPVELISHSEPQSPVSEAFRALRTSLLLSQAEHPPQVILVSSALPREGKTTAAMNLAVTLAQLGDRTVVVDADLRKPGVGKAMGIKDGKMGLTNFLVGNSDLEQVAQAHPDIANLSAVPTGPVPANPAELLSSQRLRQAIEGLRKEYKFIVLDSPPVLSATDAVILSVAADCVVLVVRSGETPKEAFSRASDLLAGVNCRLLGVVLNAVDFSSYDYYYSYKYYPYPYGGNPTHQQYS